MKFVDAVTAREQLRELAVAGYPLTFLADRIYASPTGLGGIRSGRNQRVTPAMAHAIHRLHRELRGTTADQHDIPAAAISYTRVIAARNGWGRRTAA